jgi:threonine dehydratase
MNSTIDKIVLLEEITSARKNLLEVVSQTPLQQNDYLSEKYGANIFLKREDLQVVRSFKIRGAYNKIVSLGKTAGNKSIVCASAGNHAQGVAYSCSLLGIHGVIFMPLPTPTQKVEQVKWFGKNRVEVKLVGDTFDDCCIKAQWFAKENGNIFIHPFDDEKVIAGQGTLALEIIEQSDFKIDFVFIPIGGGGLASGVACVFNALSPQTKLIGVEPQGAASMKKSIEAGKIVSLEEVDRFADGAAVKQAGELTFSICKNLLHDIALVPEGKLCSTILELYNRNAIIAEPAGALSVSALDLFKESIRGKNVVCILSGGNNDVSRMEDTKERSLMYEGIKHYFLVNFPQRAGALKEFVNSVLGDGNDITRFEYLKKTSREKGPVLMGIELGDKNDLPGLNNRMKEFGFSSNYIQPGSDLYSFLL